MIKYRQIALLFEKETLVRLKLINWIVFVLCTTASFFLMTPSLFFIGMIASLVAGFCLSNLIALRFPLNKRTTGWIVPFVVFVILGIVALNIPILGLVAGTVLQKIVITAIVVAATTCVTYLYQFSRKNGIM